MTDSVNPAHYHASGRDECIFEMLDNFGVYDVSAFCRLNAYKYRYRAEMKNGEEDLQKASWYEGFAKALDWVKEVAVDD